MAVVTTATRGAKRVARWQRRVWLAETLFGPLVVAGLVVAATVLVRRRKRRDPVVVPRPSSIPNEARRPGSLAGG